jgi:hypothetical protein
VKQGISDLPTPSTDKKRPTPLTAPTMGISQNPPQQFPQKRDNFTLEKKFDLIPKHPKVVKIAKSPSKSTQKKVFFLIIIKGGPEAGNSKLYWEIWRA